MRAKILISLIVTTYITLVACGSETTQPSDAGTTADAAKEGAASDAASATDSPFSFGFDANIDTGIPLANCGLCAASKCQDKLLACAGSKDCQAILQCVATTCVKLDGGFEAGIQPPDSKCIVECGTQNIGGALIAGEILQCVATQCGPTCLSLLGG